MGRAWSRRNLFGNAAAVLVTASITAGVLTPPQRGNVAGGIMGCDALGARDGPQFIGSTVTVLKGIVRWGSNPGPASSIDVLPTTVVAQESVPAGGTDRFDIEPGRYVLLAAPPGDWGPYASLTLNPGDEVRVDIANPCI